MVGRKKFMKERILMISNKHKVRLLSLIIALLCLIPVMVVGCTGKITNNVSNIKPNATEIGAGITTTNTTPQKSNTPTAHVTSDIDVATTPSTTRPQITRTPKIMEPKLKKTISADINGDNKPDKIEIYLLYSYDWNWAENEPKPIDSGIIPFIRATINGKKYELEIGDYFSYDVEIFPVRIENGNNVIVIETDIGGSDSCKRLHVASFANNKLNLLPVPQLDDFLPGEVYEGFHIGSKLLDYYKKEISCNETKFKSILSLPRGDYKDFYDKEGKLLDEYDMPPSDITSMLYGVTKVIDGRNEYVKIYQRIGDKWSPLRFFESTLTWDKDMRLKVIKQEYVEIND
jgi:hypothetical protein